MPASVPLPPAFCNQSSLPFGAYLARKISPPEMLQPWVPINSWRFKPKNPVTKTFPDLSTASPSAWFSPWSPNCRAHKKLGAPSAAQARGEKLNSAMNVRRVTARIFGEIFEVVKSANSTTRSHGQRFSLMPKLLLMNTGKSRPKDWCAMRTVIDRLGLSFHMQPDKNP